MSGLKPRSMKVRAFSAAVITPPVLIHFQRVPPQGEPITGQHAPTGTPWRGKAEGPAG